MNIDISNAHCGPRIQFLDHAWLRVVHVTQILLAFAYIVTLRIFDPFLVIPAVVLKSNVSESGVKNGSYELRKERRMRDVRAIVGRSLAFVAVVTEATESQCTCSRVVRGSC